MTKKRVLVILASLFVLFAVALAAAPFLINVDKYRPEILAKVNEHINGEVKLDKITLSLIGQIKFRLDGLKVFDMNKKEVVSADSSEAVIPFSSLMAFKPRLIVALNKPKIYVKRDKNKKINLLSLVKGSDEPANQSIEKPKADENKDLPQWIQDAQVSFVLKDGDIQVDDEVAGLQQKITKFNLEAKNLGISTENEVTMSTIIDTKMKDVRVQGPVEASVSIKPHFNGSKVEKVDAKVKISLSKLDMKYSTLFHKSNAVPFELNAELFYNMPTQAAEIKQAHLQFHTVKLDVTGSYKDSIANATVGSNKIELGGWETILPPVKGISGQAKFNASVKMGTKLDYQAQAELTNIQAKIEGVPSDLTINSTVKVKTDHVEQLIATITAPETDIRIEGSVVNFAAPNMNFNVTAKQINLDKLLPPPPPSTTPPPKAAPADAPVADPTKAIEGVKQNPLLAKAKAKVDVKIDQFKGRGLTATNIKAKVVLDNLKLDVSDLRVNVFDGLISGLFGLDLNPKSPTYRMGLGVSKLNIGKAIESQMPAYKDTVFGDLNLKVAGTGAGLDPNNVLKTLKSAGDFSIDNAVLQTIDVINVTKEALKGTVAKLSKILPNANLASLDKLSDEKSKYEKISASFTLKNGVLDMPNFVAKAVKSRGLDISGKTQVDLVNDKIAAEWRIVDTYNHTNAQDISINQAGIQIDNVLGDKNGLVSFPVIVGCKLTKPCFKYDLVLKDLEQKALANVKSKGTKQVKAKVKTEVKAQAKKIEGKVKEKAKEKLKDSKFKDKLKKFGL